MTAVQRVNLVLRVSVEVGVVVAFADWGVHTGEGTVAKIVLAVAAPLVGFGFWGAVDFHRFRLAERLRLIQELAISGLAAVAWYAAGRHILGSSLGALSIAYHAGVYASGQRLLNASREQPTGRSEAMPQASAAVIRPGSDGR
jgi:uncharacterized protein DUF2568